MTSTAAPGPLPVGWPREHPEIRADRMLAELAALAGFGGRADGGVDRVAGSVADHAARAWLAQRVRAFGGRAGQDEFGNVLGRMPGARSPRLLLGSHSDTVPAGGRLDGAYGVIAAWEVLRTLAEAGHPAAEWIEVVSFWDEEGASPTSPGGLTGSTAFSTSPAAADTAIFLELHIEQGPRMVDRGWELAVVEGIVAIERHLVLVEGYANHAGTTPMENRVDAGRAAAEIAVAVHEIALRYPGMVANVGSMELEPGSPNVIPGRGRVVTEFRCDRPELVDAAVRELAATAERIAGRHGCHAAVTPISAKPVVRFDPHFCALTERALRRLDRPLTRLASYAGHDAGAVGATRPAVMIFVPSVDGISHSPLEDTPDELLVGGVRALLAAALDICAELAR